MNMTVSLPEDLADFVEAKVATGRYGSSSEVIREALRLLEQREGREAETLRRAWDDGVSSGPGGRLDLDELKAEARTRRTA